MQNPSRGAPVASFATPVSKSQRTESRRPCPPPQVLKPEFNGYPLIADLHRSSAGSLSLPALSKCGSSCPPLAGAVSLCDCEAPSERLCDNRLEQMRCDMFSRYAFWSLYVPPPTPGIIGAMETTATHPRTADRSPHIRRLPQGNREPRWVLARDKLGGRGRLPLMPVDAVWRPPKSGPRLRAGRSTG